MGCPRHLQWSPVKEESVAAESVEPSQGISPGRGLKGKRQRKGRVCNFSSSSSCSITLSPMVSPFRNVVRRFSFQSE